MRSHLLVDLDGTLTDPREGIVESIRYAMGELGFPLPDPESLLWCIGPPLRQSFPTLLCTDDAHVIEEAVRLYRLRYDEVGLFENTPYVGAHNALESLRSHDITLFLSTGKPLGAARRILERFGLIHFFKETYGNELGGRFDDKRDLVSHILSEQTLDPSSCAIIGDRKHDILAGKAHDVLTIGVTWGFGSRSELESHQADHIVESFDEAIVLLARTSEPARGEHK